MTVSARFKVTEIKHVAVMPDQSMAVFQMVAASGPGNESWSKYTPSGQLQMTVTNPDAIAKLKIGKTYQLDFTPVD